MLLINLVFSHRWKKNASAEWVGVIGQNVFTLRQTADHVEYEVLPHSSTKELAINEPPAKKRRSMKKKIQVGCFYAENFMHPENWCCWQTVASETPTDVLDSHGATLLRYFGLDTSLAPLYDTWAAADERFASLAPKFPGIRVLQQDFVETLFSFICSSNNNIERIHQMIEKLCSNYGSPICELNGQIFHSFPEVNRLAGKEMEGELRTLGFGYRAGFVQKSAQYIVE
jgi:N-glycosylase/DNA lyase